MAVPKCKVSKARRDKRRGSNWKLSAPSVAVCPKCGEPVMPHRACKACGTYSGYVQTNLRLDAAPTMAVRSWPLRLSKAKAENAEEGLDCLPLFPFNGPWSQCGRL